MMTNPSFHFDQKALGDISPPFSFGGGIDYSLGSQMIPPNIFIDLLKKIVGPTDYMKVYTLIIEETKNNDKFKSLNYILQSSFLSEENKEFIFTCFQKTQKTIHAFYKFVAIFRYYKSSIKMDKDLGWNDIHPNDKNSILIYHEKSKYLFTLRDLRNIIETALTHSQNFFCKPLECKNPFNNLPFTKSHLYNIYFRLLKSQYKMSVIFHQYFLCHFDLELFEMENEYLIRDYAIQQYIQNTSVDIMYIRILNMLNQYNRRIMIHKEFPKDKLVGIMKPYLYLYIIHTTHIEGTEIRISSHNLLKKLLHKFHLFNPNFGKELFVRTLLTNKTYNITYNMVHFPFTLTDIRKVKYDLNKLKLLHIPERSQVLIRSILHRNNNERQQSTSHRRRSRRGDFVSRVSRDPLEIDIDSDIVLNPVIRGFEYPNPVAIQGLEYPNPVAIQGLEYPNRMEEEYGRSGRILENYIRAADTEVIQLNHHNHIVATLPSLGFYEQEDGEEEDDGADDEEEDDGADDEEEDDGADDEEEDDGADDEEG